MDTFFSQPPTKAGIVRQNDADREYWPEEHSEYYRAVDMWTESAREEADLENRCSETSEKIQKAIDYVMGKQWPNRRPSYRSSPVDNRMFRLFQELSGLLTDIRPIDDVKSLRGKSFKKTAESLTRLIHSCWETNDFDLALTGAVMYGQFGTSYTKIEWNQNALNGAGDFDLIPLGSTAVKPLRARGRLETAQVIVYESIVPVNELRHRYPVRGGLVRPDHDLTGYVVGGGIPDHMTQRTWSRLSPQMQRMIGTKLAYRPSVAPMTRYREYWIQDYSRNESSAEIRMGNPGTNWCYTVKPGQRLYPYWRLICKGGRTILYDGPNPWWAGVPPIFAMRLNYVPWQWDSLSEMDPQMPLQDVVNNVMAGIIDMVKKVVNPVMYAPKNALTDDQWEKLDWSMPGLRVGYNANAAAAPQFASAPSLPAWVMSLITMAKQEMDYSSGMAIANQFAAKKQVPAGDTLDQVHSAQSTPLRLKGRQIEYFLRDLGRFAVPSIMQCYNAERRMSILGLEGLTEDDFDSARGSMVPDKEDPRKFATSFTYSIAPNSLLNIRRVEEGMVMMNLRKMHDIDRRTLLHKILPDVDVDQVEARLIKEAAMMPPAPPHKGKH